MPDTLDAPPDPGGYNFHFLMNLEAISKSTQALTTLIPEQFTALNQTLHDVYAKAGQPSRGTAALRDPGISGSSSLSGTTDATARAQLNRDPTEAQVDGSNPASPMGGNTWQSRVRRGGLGQILPMPRFPGASINTNDVLQYASTVAANIADKRQQTLNANQAASTIQTMTSTGTIQIGPDGMPQMPDGSPLTPDVASDIAAGSTAAPTKLGKISDVFAGAENAYAQGKYIQKMVSGITEPAAAMRSYGYQTGYQGGGAGFLGFRSPFSGGAASGFGQKMSEMGFALGNNVSPSQAGTIYNNLFSNGWYGGQSTDDMRTAGARMMNTNPYIGSMPQYYDMMDKATRQGAASLNSFNEVMGQIPAAAKAAHTSITDTMAQMDALGSYTSSTGGIYASGLNDASAWQSATGQPSAILGQLLQNPLVQGQLFAASGLMPQLQGLATPYQQTQGIMNSINLLNKGIVGPGAKTTIDPLTGLPQTTSQQSQKVGLIAQQLGIPADVVSSLLSNETGILHGSEMQNSAAAYNSNVSYNATHGNWNKAYNQLTGRAWSGLQAGMKDAVDSQGHHIFEDWNDYDSLMSKDSQANRLLDGKTMLTPQQAHAQAQLAARRQVTNAGDSTVLSGATSSQLHQALIAAVGYRAASGSRYTGPESISDISARQRATAAQYLLKHGDVSSKTMANVSSDRQKEIDHYVNQNTQKFGAGTSNNSGPSLTIGLSAQAKKLFNISGPNGQQKANLNAGSASVNLNSYVNGPTADPTPNMDTAATNMGDSTGFNDQYGDSSSDSLYGN